ncbi:MAG: hypothetical protein IKY82_07945 [Alistipes sp.]|nr:hypothetical protein [Alistipes sp.]
MGEFKKKWFQTVWLILMAAQLLIDRIQRSSDALWAQGPGLTMLNKVLMWIIFPMTLLLFILHNIESWRKGERHFWRMWQKGSLALLVGGALGSLLVVVVKKCKGEALEIDNGTRLIILAVFSVIGLVCAFARYKFKTWREK